MKPKSTDITLLENALLAIERVLAHADSDAQEALFHGPTDNMSLEGLNAAARTEEQWFRASAAQSAANVCLSAAAALVEVSRTLIGAGSEPMARDPEREWEALITYTKIASRSAHRAALIMASQHAGPAARGGAPRDGGERPAFFAALS